MHRIGQRVATKSLTTKDTKVHEGRPGSDFLCGPSCPLWFLPLLYDHGDLAVLFEHLDADRTTVSFQEEADTSVLNAEIVY